MTFTGYVCVSPHGNAIPTTIRPNADESWQVLRVSVTEPDTLIDKGWKVQAVSCVVQPTGDIEDGYIRFNPDEG